MTGVPLIDEKSMIRHTKALNDEKRIEGRSVFKAWSAIRILLSCHAGVSITKNVNLFLPELKYEWGAINNVIAPH